MLQYAEQDTTVDAWTDGLMQDDANGAEDMLEDYVLSEDDDEAEDEGGEDVEGLPKGREQPKQRVKGRKGEGTERERGSRKQRTFNVSDRKSGKRRKGQRRHGGG